MDEKFKQRVRERYQQALQRGERFWPDSIYKDLLVSLGLFLLLVGLAMFLGVKPEPKVDPNDTAYVPRPEWYFLFLFEFLKFIPGSLEWVGAIVVPSIGVAALLFLPFIDRNPYRHYSKRVLALTVMGVIVVTIVMLTIMASVPAPAPEQLTIKTMQKLAGLIIPAIALILLFVFSAMAKEPAAQRKVLIVTSVVASLAIIALAVGSAIPLQQNAPPKEEVQIAGSIAEQVAQGEELYALNCVECHGADGDVTVIQGVEGLDGKAVTPISSKDVMYTFTDDTLFNIINDGLSELGMVPFGTANGGELSPGEIEAIVAYMRYTWDDRMELPEDQRVGGIPSLAEGEVPSYEIHIEPLAKRYCVSCHRPGKENNNYLMTTYDEILNTGDDAPNVVAGDPNSILLQVIQGHTVQGVNGEIDVMPPNGKLLKDEYIDMFVRWVMAGMPQTAEDAAAAAPAP